MRQVGTSDRNFYDRHYFNVHACRDDFFVIMGMGQYPNLGTQDAFVSLRQGRRQTTLRSSRALGDRGDMACGPMRIEVLEGLKRIRIVIDPNDSGIEADLVFDGTHQPQLEPRQVQRRNGRVIHDVMRYARPRSTLAGSRRPGRPGAPRTCRCAVTAIARGACARSVGPSRPTRRRPAALR